jgi:hypothetical protein
LADHIEALQLKASMAGGLIDGALPEGGEVAGFVQYGPQGRDLYLEHISVDPAHASLGYQRLQIADFAPYMRDIERSQIPFMDVSKRVFMRKTVRNS